MEQPHIHIIDYDILNHNVSAEMLRETYIDKSATINMKYNLCDKVITYNIYVTNIFISIRLV
jgi:hypothetical protein